jgi:hypothetical protein
MPAPTNTSLLEIVNAVAKSVGHPASTDVTASTDEAILRLAYYANIAGTELCYMNPGGWSSLQATATLSIFADTPGQREKGFDLPSDFKAMIDDTHWDASTQLPAIGPVNPQDWQWMVVRQAMITTRFLWRIRNKQIWIKSPPVSPQNLTFEYISKFWAVDGGSGTKQDVMNKNDDYHVYPWQLMVLYTRAKWFENEGYDSTGAYLDFKKAYDYEVGSDKGATALSLVPGTGYPYISAIKNIPDTGYGAA